MEKSIERAFILDNDSRRRRRRRSTHLWILGFLGLVGEVEHVRFGSPAGVQIGHLDEWGDRVAIAKRFHC